MSPDDIPLYFQVPCRTRKAALRTYFRDLVRKVTPGRSVSCIVTNDAELRRLNRAFRNKNQPTDVLSFPVVAPGPEKSAGDLAISLDRAREQAAEHGHSLYDELRILLLHGTLHLAGFDHDTDQGEMARVESRWRRHFGLPDGLIERAHQ